MPQIVKNVCENQINVFFLLKNRIWVQILPSLGSPKLVKFILKFVHLKFLFIRHGTMVGRLSYQCLQKLLIEGFAYFIYWRFFRAITQLARG